MEEESCAEQLSRAVEHGRLDENTHMIIINIATGAREHLGTKPLAPACQKRHPTTIFNQLG